MKRTSAAISYDAALEAVIVHECAEMNAACKAAGLGTPHPAGWWAVVTEVGGAVAYFADRGRALEYRLILVGQLSGLGR